MDALVAAITQILDYIHTQGPDAIAQLTHYSQVKLKALLSMSKITHLLPVDPIKI